MKKLHLGDTKADLNSLLGLATKFGLKELKTRWSILHMETLKTIFHCSLSLSLLRMLPHMPIQIGGYPSFLINEKAVKACDPCSAQA